MTIAAQIGRVNSRIEKAARAHDFAAYATALLRSGGDPVKASRDAEAEGLPQRVQATLKAAVSGSVTDLAGLTPYRVLSEGFSSTLTNATFDGVLADANIVPLHVRFSVVTADATAASAGEGAAKRISSVSIGSGAVTARKAAVQVAVSEELLRYQSAVGLIENSLRAGVADAVDSIFLLAVIAGTTPIAASGTSAAAALHDIRILLDACTVSSNSRFHLIVSPATCARLAVMTTVTVDGPAFPTLTVNGGTIGGIQIHSSDALTTQAVLIDTQQVIAAADPVEIRVSQNASLQMDSAPTQTIAPTPTPTAVVSMFQTNSTAIVCERRFGWSLLRASAAQSLSGVAWAT
jgi:hypothetical protein